jgi:hypothetical protein
VRTGLASEYAETRRALPRPAQGPLLGTCHGSSGDQQASHQAQEEAEQDREGRLTDHSWDHPATDEVSGQPSLPERVKSQA